MKPIDLHKEWCKKGEMKNNGLCRCVPKLYKDDLSLFWPKGNECVNHQAEGYGVAFWGWNIYSGKEACAYNSFRQSIVLLICAMNGEL